MAEVTGEVAVAFATQTQAGSYDTTLDGITTSLTAAQGLILGAEVGIKKSGLSISFQRILTEFGQVGSSYTRKLSSLRRVEVPTFTFTWPFCGKRTDASNPPVDADFVPWTAVDALLEACGLSGAASGSPGHVYKFASTSPISALIYVNKHRVELLDCRASHSVSFVPGELPICTSTIYAGSVKNHAQADIPSTLTYSEQSSVGVPVCETMGHTWKNSRSFTSPFTLEITPEITTTPDSEATGGIRKSLSDRVTRIVGNFFADDNSSDEIFDYTQLIEETYANLESLSFQVGDTGTATNPVEAVKVTLPKPEVVDFTPDVVDEKSVATVTAVAKHETANSELEIEFL